MLPKTLKNAQLFIDGGSYLGRVEEINPPNIKRKMQDYEPLGMNGTIEIDMGIEKLELDFMLCEYSSDVIIKAGVVAHNGVQLRIRGAVERDDSSNEVSYVEIHAHGRIRDLEFEAMKKGETGKLKVMLTISYYKFTEDGNVLAEIDIVNMIENWGGVDRLAAQRQAIGL